MPASAATLDTLIGWLSEFRRLVADERGHLTELDSAIGDADHGINMDRGMTAVMAAIDLQPPESIEALFKTTGMALVTNVGGASGPLYGTFFLRFGAAAGTVGELSAQELAKALRAGLEGVVARGKAEAGDKTMFDALEPALERLETSLEAGAELRDALREAAAAADRGRDATTPMLARKGRASYLGERSIGHQDPGATSAALLVSAAARTLGGGE